MLPHVRRDLCWLLKPDRLCPPALPTACPTICIHPSTPPPRPQAADPDVEAVVLHSTEAEGPIAHTCRGAGSFQALMASLGQPLPESEPAPAPEADAARQPEASPELPQAATVS